MEKRVLLVATTIGYQIRSFGEAARKLGIRLMFVSDRCDRLDDPWRDQAIAVRFHDEDRSVESVVAACANAVPDGVIALGDRPAVLAARLARGFGLSWHPPDAARISRNKLFARRAFKSAGLPTPRFKSVSLDEDVRSRVVGFPYPAVVKPLALSGSRGVMRVDNVDQCVEALGRLRRLLESADVLIERDHVHRRALVESFISGPEYAVEGILEHGRFHPLAIFDKPDPLDGPFFEETIYPRRRLQQATFSSAFSRAWQTGLAPSGCITAPFMRNVASAAAPSTCWRLLRVPSAGSAHDRFGS